MCIAVLQATAMDPRHPLLVFPLPIMAFLLVVLQALMFYDGIHGKVMKSLIGPYIVYADYFNNCEPNLPSTWFLRATHFNPRKPKELQVLSGNWTVSFMFDANTWMKSVVDVRSNNQWKENAFVLNFKNNACRALKENAPEIYNQVFKQAEDKGAHCALKPGTYEVNNTRAVWNFPNLPVMPYGHYRYRSWFGKPEKVYYGCWVAEAWVVPKPE
ncbi:uncharacterized protein LOC113216609 [Frankliniella occidentalis]|uniref:Uncharacterized protein LOC113216609 n=1 Tax=Frankliniella occidentalis TaxID=133901 RepID=A0A6J1THB5_FRAOC|nr:uncharacterized protein LOC113216609 [Frankliniella occidentalis]